MVVFRHLVLVLPLLIAPTISPCQENSTNDESVELEPTQELTPESVLAELSLDQKIGQLLFLGFKGNKYNDEIKKTLSVIRPGGLVVFRKNIKSAEQISTFNHAAQIDFIENNSVPVFIAIDQEGGIVTRIKSKPPLPSALALGQTNSRDIVGRMGFYTGTLMRALGFNMNLAPVLDVASPDQPSFIGTRSFSGDSTAVGRMAYAFAQGLQMAGVVSTLKHYPGHGGPAADSHKHVPIMQDDLNGLLSTHLKPFTYLTHNFDAPAIMVAHVMYPKIDKQPATYSKILVEDVLRKKLNFKGLVITDDIEMAGAKKIKDPGEQAIRAIEAGVDMIMVAWHKEAQIKAFQALKSAVKSGRIKQARIDNSVQRILDIKLRYGLFNKPPTPSMKAINTIFSDPSFKRAVDQVLVANIERSLQTSQLQRPLKEDQQFNVFAHSDRFFDSFSAASKGYEVKFFKITTLERLAHNIQKNNAAISILYVSSKKSLNIANSLPTRLSKKVLLVNTGIPANIKNAEKFLAVVNIFYPHAGAGQTLAKVLFSDDELEVREPATVDEAPAPLNPDDSAAVSRNLIKANSKNGHTHTHAN